MPFLNLRTVKGLLNDDQKKHLMAKFTELLVETEGGGDPICKLVWILIEEEDQRTGKSANSSPRQKRLLS